jgi:hypothetical protein
MLIHHTVAILVVEYSTVNYRVRNVFAQNFFFVKGGSEEERLYKKLYSTANLNFIFLSIFVYLVKNSSSQFFSNWKSTEPVFCSEELSCLPYKNQNKSLTLSFCEGKYKFAVLWGLFIKPFFHWATFTFWC